MQAPRYRAAPSAIRPTKRAKFLGENEVRNFEQVQSSKNSLRQQLQTILAELKQIVALVEDVISEV